MFVAEVMFEEFREPRYAPPPLLKRMVMAGHLGRKTGRGFYTLQLSWRGPGPPPDLPSAVGPPSHGADHNRPSKPVRRSVDSLQVRW